MNAKNTYLQNKQIKSTYSKKKIKTKQVKDRTDWNRVRNMTEAEIMAGALSDPDAQPLTKSELKQFKRVNPPESVDVKQIREKLHLTQSEFAGYFGVSTRTIQEWEQGRRKPTSTARNFLKVIAREPRAVQRALRSKDK